ncbi:DNA-binding transcriptional LysR family regulator [Pararhizobium capsulatum DSM 1112]|uniref:DNA-binding transcriptional LysR family regulator n=1 Tax=Pararhizobium capsulatum DSM 1112 TaxID=1121113 RepID=A0ABU0BRY1_9HYPH|nr:LysR family transcriptional regulator [Pararhizobium capsulatum]MDQ0320999.1 DNA-binding transcriptional LysR family regulator [Pararhizobium capsulatum DSM 1112]
MDIATLALVHAVLVERGIRRAARVTGRPPASVTAALKRMEAAIAVPLVRREGGNLVPTLEAQRRFGDFAAARLKIEALLAPANRETVAVPAIGISALERFLTVARSGSIRSAAQQIGVGQPQLTRQIADMERTLGYALLTRSAAGVACTAQGLDAMPVAEALSEIWARLSRASADRFRRTAATWRLGSVMPLGPESEIARMLASLTARWHQARPRQPLFLSSTTADELIAGLKSRRFDAVLLDIADFPSEFEGRLVSQAPLALAGQAEFFAQGRPLADILTSHPIVVPSLRSGLRQQAARFLENTLNDVERQRLTIAEVDSIPVIINLVLNHGYLSVLPQSSLSRVRNAPAMIRLDASYAQSLSLVWPKNALSRQLGETMLAMMRADENGMTEAESVSPHPARTI